MLAGLLSLGNVSFEATESGESAVVSADGREWLRIAAQQLGWHQNEQLEDIFTQRTTRAGTANTRRRARASTQIIPLTLLVLRGGTA